MELYPIGFPSKETPVVVNKIVVTYAQEQDDCSEVNIDQFLEITLEDAGAGPYFVIKTDRWAIDNIDDATNLLIDFNKRICK